LDRNGLHDLILSSDEDWIFERLLVLLQQLGDGDPEGEEINEALVQKRTLLGTDLYQQHTAAWWLLGREFDIAPHRDRQNRMIKGLVEHNSIVGNQQNGSLR
jgi:hypothetical protein